MASAKVGSPMMSCQVENGNWLVINVDPLPYLSWTSFLFPDTGVLYPCP